MDLQNCQYQPSSTSDHCHSLNGKHYEQIKLFFVAMASSYKLLTFSFIRSLLRFKITANHNESSPNNIISLIVHWMIWYTSKVCCSIPLEASWEDTKEDFLLLKPKAMGWKKAATAFIPYTTILRVSFAVVASLPSVTFVTNGMLTTDFCIFTLACTIFLMASFHSVLLVWYQEDLMLLYNRTVTLRKKLQDKYFQMENALEIYDGGQMVLNISKFSWDVSVLLTPILVLVLGFYIQDSPLGLSFYLVSETTEASNLRNLLALYLIVFDWILFMAMTYCVTFSIYVVIEMALILNATIKFISAWPAFENGRKEKRHRYNQLQLLVSQFNSSFAKFLPYPIYTANATAVVAATFLLRPNSDIASTLPGLYPLMLQLVLSNTFIVFPMLRYLEKMKMESDTVRKDVQLVILKRTTWGRKEGKLIPRVHVRGKRLNKLRPLRVKFGDFKYIDEGMMVDFAIAFLDNVVNLFFMVHIKNQSWLLKLPR